MLLSDGYALCSAVGFHGVEGGPLMGGFAFGFGTPTTSTPTANVRKTTDGKFQVTQTFVRDTLEKEIVITVTIRNISTGAIGDVLFSRFFDADITDRYNYSGATKASAFIWDKSSADPGRGLELSGRTYTFPRSAHILWIANVALIDACFPGPTSDNLGMDNDWTGRVIYTIGTIAAGASKIIKFVYRVM